jgi:DNA-binding CsgD family transcriptional regulator
MGLVERQNELRAISASIASAADGRGNVVLLEGAPGVGKTALVEAAAELAGQDGMRVLRGAGAELERDLGWEVARSMLAGQVGDGSLTGAAAGAAGLFGAGGEPDLGGDALGRILHGLYWLVSDLAARQPLLIAVDDVHWADPPSARWLAHLAARIADLPVLLLLASRPEQETRLWSQIAASEPSAVLTLAPLSQAGTRAQVAARFGPAQDRLADACHEASGGNPFFLSELLRSLEAEPELPPPEAIRTLRPDSIRRAVLLRLGQLGESARQLCFAVALLGHRATVELAGELAGLGPEPAVEAADALRAADVIRLAPGPEFVHPLVLGVVRGEIPPAQAAAWHLRASELLAARGAAPPELAPHLLASEPRARAKTVRALREAAASVLALGAPETAAGYLRRALAEPPPDAERVDVLLELGRAEAALGAPEAPGRLREALAIAADPVKRGEVVLVLAAQLAVGGDVAAAAEMCQSAANDLSEAARELRLQLLAMGIMAAGQDLFASVPDPRDMPFADLAGDTPGERLLLAAVATSRTGSRPSPSGELYARASRALGGGRLLADVGADSVPFWYAQSSIMFAERYAEAETLVEAALADSRRRGSPRGFGHCMCFSSPLQLRLGHLVEAEEEARRALEIFAPEPLIGAYARSFLAEALIERGELTEARAVLDQVQLTSLPPVAGFALLRGCDARLRRLQGDAPSAAEQMGIVGDQLGEISPAFWPWRAEAALALKASGDDDRARELAAEEVGRGEAIGSRWVQAYALYALALAEDSLEPLERAEALTRYQPIALERARVLAELGAALRRRKRTREAAPALQEALELADRCGALPIAERAREELRIATGAKPRRARRSGPDALTPSELRVCQLAARGHSNRDIAQTLFVSLRTVETHLTHAYQKLDISSRQQLATALGEAAGPT